MKLQQLSAILSLMALLSPQVGLAENLKYVTKSKQGVIKILKDLNLKPIYGPKGYLKQTLELNPKIAASPNNTIQIGQLVVLPITALSGTDKFKSAEPGFIERTPESDKKVETAKVAAEPVKVEPIKAGPAAPVVMPSTTQNTAVASIDDKLYASQVLVQGQREIGGSFSFSSGVTANYQVLATLSHFQTDNLSFDGLLGVAASVGGVAVNTGLGGSYYFFKTGRWAPLVSQMFGANIAKSTTGWGRTNIGTKYILTPQLALKLTGELNYELSQASQRQFVVLGGFNFLL
jgi:hypothetical protein